MDRISSKLLQEEASVAKKDFADALKRLNEMRPKSDRSFDIKCLEGEFNLKKELEAILMDTRFQNHCKDDMAYASLWQEYAGMVSDFSEVFEYMMFAPLHIKCNYRAFIQYSQFVEVAWREFQKSHFLFVEGIKAFQGCSKELGILFKMLGLFVERMKQRIERDIISNLSSDAFLDEFGKRPLLFMANLSEMANEEGENFDFLTDEQNTLVKTSSLLVDTYNRSLFLVKQEKFDNDESFQEPSPDEKIVQEFNSKPLSFLSMPSSPLKQDCKNESQPRPQQHLPCHPSRREELLQNIPMDQISEWNASAEQSRKSKGSIVIERERESLNLTFMTCQDEGEKANQNSGDSLQLLRSNREAQEEEEEVRQHEQNKTGFNLVFERPSNYNQASPRKFESFWPSLGPSTLQTAIPQPTFSSLPPPLLADRGLESSDKRKRTQLSPNKTSRPRFESSPLSQQPVQSQSHPNRNPPGFNPFSREHAQQASESKKRPGAGLQYQLSMLAPWSAPKPPPAAALTSSPLAKTSAPNISGEPQRMLSRKSTEPSTHQDKHEMTISLVRQIKNELEGRNLPDIFRLAANLETFLEGTSSCQNAQRERKEQSAEPRANNEVSWQPPPLFSLPNQVLQQQPKTVPSITPVHPEEKSPLRQGTVYCPSVNSCTPSQMNVLNARQESSLEFEPDEADHQNVPNQATRGVGGQIMTVGNFMNSATSMLVDQEVPNSRTDTFETFGGRNAGVDEGGKEVKKKQTPLLFALAKSDPTYMDKPTASSFGAGGTSAQLNFPSKASPIRERASNLFQQGSASRLSHESRSRASPLRLPQQNLNESIFLEQSPGAADAMKTHKNLFFGNSLFGNPSPHCLPQGTQILDSSPLRSEREHPQSSIRASLHAQRDGPGLFDYVESGRTNFVTGEKEMVFNIVKRSSRRISEISETPQKAGCHEMATRRKSFLPPNSDCDDELSELYLGDLGGDRTTPRKKPEDAEWLGLKAVPLPQSQVLSVFNNERKSSPTRTILGQVSTNVMENPFIKKKPATTLAKGETPLRISSERRRSVKFSPISHQHYI